MKPLLITLLLSSTLFAELYECRNSFLSVQTNSITEITEDNETIHARKSFGAFCYDFYDAGQDLYLCIEKEGSTFHFTSSKDKWSEKCTRVD